jgi:hypothetical protein
MKRIAALLGLLALGLWLMGGCGDSPTKGDTSDKKGPAFRVDSMFAGSRVLTRGDSVVTDSIFLKGHVSDTSGIDLVTITIGGVVTPAAVIGDSVWRVTAYLRPGANPISLRAEDSKNNETSLSENLYYSVKYFPLDTNTFWKFSGSLALDTVLIKVDSSHNMMGNVWWYRLSFFNPIAANPNTALYTFNYNGAFVINSLADSLIPPRDTLFMEKYNTQPGNYGGKTIRFIGDTTMAGAEYRNCVKVTMGASKDLAGILSFILSPYKGIVGIYANGKGYPLTSSR